MAAKYFPQSWLFVDAFLLCAHNHLRECFLARVAALYVALTWCRVPHVGRTKRSSRGFDVASCTILPICQKQQFFLIIVKPVHDETQCSVLQPASRVIFLAIPRPRGRFQAVNFWTGPSLTIRCKKTASQNMHPQPLPVCKIHFYFPFLKQTLPDSGPSPQSLFLL